MPESKTAACRPSGFLLHSPLSAHGLALTPTTSDTQQRPAKCCDSSANSQFPGKRHCWAPAANTQVSSGSFTARAAPEAEGADPKAGVSLTDTQRATLPPSASDSAFVRWDKRYHLLGCLSMSNALVDSNNSYRGHRSHHAPSLCCARDCALSLHDLNESSEQSLGFAASVVATLQRRILRHREGKGLSKVTQGWDSKVGLSAFPGCISHHALLPLC